MRGWRLVVAILRDRRDQPAAKPEQDQPDGKPQPREVRGL